MKTIFIINPKSGQCSGVERLIRSIKAETLRQEAEAQIYLTKCAGDAKTFVSDYCRKFGGARFVACGGDGTLNEVLNGAVDCPDAEIGVIPMGTGNDFCRNFGAGKAFNDVAAQLSGDVVLCDAIRYRTEMDDRKETGYCVNMCNIGFDCHVADDAATLKKKPMISGSLAYLVSIFVNLVKKRGANLQIELDGEVKHCGPLLLTSVANGSYCGGGIKSNPLASVCDGKMNVNIIKDVSRLQFVKLLPYYMKGTFLDCKGIDQIISSVSCKKVCIKPLDGKLRLCNDGDIIEAGIITFEIVPQAFRFVVPQ